VSEPDSVPRLPARYVTLDEDEVTATDHPIPSFVGEPPRTIPGAPDWANSLFAEMQQWQRSNRESIHELRSQLQVMSANQDLMRHDIELLTDEMRTRANSQERESLRAKRRLEMLADATWGGMRPPGWRDA
jgi:hypothetical protein